MAECLKAEHDGAEDLDAEWLFSHEWQTTLRAVDPDCNVADVEDRHARCKSDCKGGQSLEGLIMRYTLREFVTLSKSYNPEFAHEQGAKPDTTAAAHAPRLSALRLLHGERCARRAEMIASGAAELCPLNPTSVSVWAETKREWGQLCAADKRFYHDQARRSNDAGATPLAIADGTSAPEEDAVVPLGNEVGICD